MTYLQGPTGCLREELVVRHEFLEAHPPDFYRFRLLEPVRKLQHWTWQPLNCQAEAAL